MEFSKNLGWVALQTKQNLHPLYSKEGEELIGEVFVLLPLWDAELITTKVPNKPLGGRLSRKGNDQIHLYQGSLVQLRSDGFCAFSQLHGELPK